MTYRFTFGRDARVNGLLGAGHFLSHFYQLCLPPLFIAWQQAFDVSFAELGLAMAVMAGAAGGVPTPVGVSLRPFRAPPPLVRAPPFFTPPAPPLGPPPPLWPGFRLGHPFGPRPS